MTGQEQEAMADFTMRLLVGTLQCQQINGTMPQQ